MFGLKKKNHTAQLIATQDGTAVLLSQVPDPVFAEKMLGDGIAILPTGTQVLSPVSGTITQVMDTLHAYGITTDDGLDILVHIGINTVELKGEGFHALVKEGDKVTPGTPLAEVNLAFLKEKGYETHTPILITNMDAVESFTPCETTTIAGETVIATYRTKK